MIRGCNDRFLIVLEILGTVKMLFLTDFGRPMKSSTTKQRDDGIIPLRESDTQFVGILDGSDKHKLFTQVLLSPCALRQTGIELMRIGLKTLSILP